MAARLAREHPDPPAAPTASDLTLQQQAALTATWKRDLVRRLGRVLADEARAKGAG